MALTLLAYAVSLEKCPGLSGDVGRGFSRIRMREAVHTYM